MTELPRTLSGKAVTSHYTLLAGDERFRLAVEASARGDGDELARLRDTASMRAYKVTDPDYLDRIDASREIATALALFVGPRLAELRMLRNTRDTLAGPVAVAVAARVRGERQ